MENGKLTIENVKEGTSFMALVMSTVLNTELSPNFLVGKFSGNAQFPQGFGQLAQNSA